MATLSTLAECPYFTVGALLLLTALVNKVVKSKLHNPSNLPFPPGPKGYPIIGSLLNMPKENPWRVYDQWRKSYGDLIYFEVLGQSFLILGSLEKANHLFEKRSSIYSDRPKMPMIVDLMGWDWCFCFNPYGSRWKKGRKAFYEHFNAGAVVQYRPIQIQETHDFLKRLLETPDDFINHIRHMFAAIILRISYGIKVKSTEDLHVKNAEMALEGVAEAAIPGSFLVDLIPALKYVPEWLPGASFQTKAGRWRQLNKDVVDMPFDAVKQQMRNGTAVPSVASTLIDALPEKCDLGYDEEEFLAKQVSAVAYVGAADTTNSVVQAFFLSMVLYPDTMTKAQAELDKVLGPNRLPDFSDRPLLPYINALIKELMRWHIVANLGVPHMSSEDDEYEGYFIPKGTIVMENIWSILHDPEVFENPEDFIPERYLKDGQLNPNVRDSSCAVFGGGRRICPGRYLSDDSLFIIVASTLALFDIQCPLDEDGNPVKLIANFSSGLMSHPIPFKCRITPRFSDRASLMSLYDSLHFR